MNLLLVSRETKEEAIAQFFSGRSGDYGIHVVEDLERNVRDCYYKEAMDWLDGWNRKTEFYKRVMYEGHSLWWIKRRDLYLWLEDLFADIDALKRLVNTGKYDCIYMLGLNRYWEDIVVEIYHSWHGIKVGSDSYCGSTSMGYSRKKRRKYSMRYFKSRGIRSLRALQGTVRLIYGRFDVDNRSRVLVRTLGVAWQEDGCFESFDPYLGNVIDEFNGRGYRVTELDVMSNSDDGWRTFREKRYPCIANEGYPWSLIKAIPRARRESRRIRRFFDSTRYVLSPDNESYRHEGINVQHMFLGQIWKFMNNELFKYILGVEYYKNILRKEKPSLVLLIAEGGTGALLVMAANLLDVRVVSMQHGDINIGHSGLIFPKDADLKTLPICDKTLVFGKYYKRLLIANSVYTDSMIEVVGKPRLDRIEDWKSAGDQCKIEFTEKTLFFSSQSRIQEQAAEVLMQGMKELGEGYFLNIKLHPVGDSKEAYVRAAEKYGVTNFQIITGELYASLVCCDLHISAFSTVLSEAVAFGKPNLILDVPGVVDFGKWVEQGVADRLSSFGSFKEAVETILYDESKVSVMERNRESYVSRSFYKLDGNSTRRVCDACDSVVRSG